MTVHSFARSKLPRQNMMNNVRLFSRVLVMGNSMCIDRYNCALPTRSGLTAYRPMKKRNEKNAKKE